MEEIRLRNIEGTFSVRKDIYTFIKDTTLLVDRESAVIIGELVDGAPRRTVALEEIGERRVDADVDVYLADVHAFDHVPES